MSQETDLFARLGGTRAIAERLGEAPSTVQSWKAAKRIPAAKQPAVLDLGEDLDGNPITAEDVIFPFGRSDVESASQPSSAEAA